MKKDLCEKLRAALREHWEDDVEMIDYCARNTEAACELSNGIIVTVEKQGIVKDFCFGWSTCGWGPEFSEALAAERRARGNEDFFIRENLKQYEWALADISAAIWSLSDNTPRAVLFARGRSPVLYRLEIMPYQFLRDRFEDEPAAGKMMTSVSGERAYIPTVEDLALIRAAYESARDIHEKRVRAYLKRYGTKAVRMNTYCIDD